jgi:hypothetical protein
MAADASVNRVARWDGSAWHPLGTGVNSYVLALATWDSDDGGPEPVAGGYFLKAGEVVVNHIARWNGGEWQPLGTGMNGTVEALTTWDPDGAGGGAPQLIAGGGFTSAGGMTAASIARWDGSAWHGLGSGMSSSVYALAAWDPDGDGPVMPQLIAGGFFVEAGGVTVNRVARWDGTAWQPMGAGMNGPVYALTVWDADGDGPEKALPVAGGSFTSAGGVAAGGIAVWDGALWRALGPGVNGAVFSLTTWDPDGAGTGPLQVVAGGSFTQAGAVTVNRIARWNGPWWGGSWQGVGAGMNGHVYALGSWTPAATGADAPELVAGGVFTAAGGLDSAYFARYSTVGGAAPSITGQPQSVASCPPGPVALSVAAAGTARLSYRWECRSGTGQTCGDLVDGPYADPVTGLRYTIAGAATPRLVISDVVLGNHSNVLGFAARVSNECGSVTSDPAVVTICRADYNCDGFVDGVDYDRFNNDFESGEMSADINGDGFLDGIDYDAFMNGFEAGC